MLDLVGCECWQCGIDVVVDFVQCCQFVFVLCEYVGFGCEVIVLVVDLCDVFVVQVCVEWLCEYCWIVCE